jgi:hypothetical protein
MSPSKKPDLDEATLQIAQRMLNTPPKPHDEMKLGNSKRGASKQQKKTSRRRKAK